MVLDAHRGNDTDDSDDPTPDDSLPTPDRATEPVGSSGTVSA
jgi:hypothetical protein